MATARSSELGTKSIDRLLWEQGLPASIGFLVLSLNIVIDTIFVGNWIGPNAIAAINVVLPVSFFISALGMAIGIGGGSIISRALGADNKKKVFKTFGNALTATLVLVSLLVIAGLTFIDALIPMFGGKGELFEPAKVYYRIILYGVPVLALNMMYGNVIRSEGKPKHAMYGMIISAVVNIVGDYLFIKVLDYGMAGAAWATALSYVMNFIYYIWFYRSGKSEIRLRLSNLGLDMPILKEIGALGFVTLSQQAVISFIYLIVNNVLFEMGGEAAVTVYAIVGRLLMFALFPVLGVMQGFVPIAGYNYGAAQPKRVHESINKAIMYAFILALIIFGIIQGFAEGIASVFTNDAAVMAEAPNAIRWVFAATPIIAFQLIGSAYFQAIGKAVPALLLTLSRQGFFFVPLVLILPQYLGEWGVWLSFPIADFLSTVVTALFLNIEIRRDLKPRELDAERIVEKRL